MVPFCFAYVPFAFFLEVSVVVPVFVFFGLVVESLFFLEHALYVSVDPGCAVVPAFHA